MIKIPVYEECRRCNREVPANRRGSGFCTPRCQRLAQPTDPDEAEAAYTVTGGEAGGA